MKTSNEIRAEFLRFFESKNHKIIASDSMVIKGDPSLMFTNAGMNQFKDIFLQNKKAESKRIVNSQKCLRVSGKHNDLEEVGIDTYHHTMFEMLGNWSFDDYFKKEAVAWCYEFLVNVLKIDKTKLYATVFAGDKYDKTDVDKDAYNYWLEFLPKEQVLYFGKEDNFWEMGTTGPCGPCSEIHIDLRSNEEKHIIKGADLVNKDHPQVIEIWNLVFVQYQRTSDSKLHLLPERYIDTGMGFERLCMVLQNKKSNYDTDVFQPIIAEIEKLSKKKYGENEEIDIAMRVIADHLRAVAFSIADGQLPSNNKAGYVIRRILRRAVRYYYTKLNIDEAIVYKLVSKLIDTMGDAFPELKSQKKIITQIIKEEENSFLKTIGKGISILNKVIAETNEQKKNIIDGKIAFLLYDTYGFPLDLTNLILSENNLMANEKEFDKEMQIQKNRSRTVAKAEVTNDWIIVNDKLEGTEFIGYDKKEAEVKIIKYRESKTKKDAMYQIVIDKTPFFAEGGGQIGDSGILKSDEEIIPIINTINEHNIILHISKKLPKNLTQKFTAIVSKESQYLTACNHSATHLLHYQLRSVLGSHIEQKGSSVDDKRLRFDFSHFSKIDAEMLTEIENKVNEMIYIGFDLDEKRSIAINEAKKIGAMSLFGEKYGDKVRVIKFAKSIELCAGIHVKNTQKIRLFKIISESAIASGIRRIEAITNLTAINFLLKNNETLNNAKQKLNSPKNFMQALVVLQEENKNLNEEIELLELEQTKNIKISLKQNAKLKDGKLLIVNKINVNKAEQVKKISFDLVKELENSIIILAAEIKNKALISIIIDKNLITEQLKANQLIKKISKEIAGGGGGQDFYATAGGKNSKGIEKALEILQSLLS